jgi:cytochrome c553
MLTMVSALTGCVVSGRSGSKLATITVAALEGEEYDRIQFSVTQHESDKPIVSQEVPRGPATIAITLKPDTYHFALSYFRGSEQTLSTAFCGDADKTSHKQSVKPGLNQLKIIVCTPEGKAVEDASVEITPLKKQSVNAEKGLALYTTQCAACHGDVGQGTAVGTPLRGNCKTCDSKEAFIKVTMETMPVSNPGSCNEACAADIAAYVFTKFR